MTAIGREGYVKSSLIMNPVRELSTDGCGNKSMKNNGKKRSERFKFYVLFHA